MKVLFDHQTFTLQEFGGISRYFYEIIKELNQFPNVQTECSLFLSNNEYLKDGILQHSPFFSTFHFKGKRRLMLAINKMKSKRIHGKGEFDIFHPTYYDPYYLSNYLSKPIVITCLDMIHEKYIQDDKETIRNKRKVLQRADKIIAISNSTKKDIMEYYNIPEERISVTYLASSLRAGQPGKSYSKDRYFLYVGARNLYKNFISFVKAIAPLLKSKDDLFLNCVGGGNFSQDEKKIFTDLKLERKIIWRPGSDSNLVEMYSSAIAFFYPSLYEGFGIPILEAMNCGCPVAASGTSSLPEVAGDAAIYFDPTNEESILGAAETMLDNDKLRSDLVVAGLGRANEFSWNRTALETHKIYLSLL